tara:strand:+ start:293 stop:529 length:237 start_codon:yes stop_codon:yes gene_type:complete
MKSLNNPENIKNKSLEKLQKEAIEILTFLEKQENLSESVDKYQRLIELNNIIENKFREKSKSISSKKILNIKKLIKKI